MATVDIKTLVRKFGVDAVVFHMPRRPEGVTWHDFFHKDHSPKQAFPCRSEERQYKAADGYKVRLIHIEDGYYTEEFYQSDFESMSRGAALRDEYFVTVGDRRFNFDYGADQDVFDLPDFERKVA